MDPLLLSYIGPIIASMGLVLCFPDRPRAARWAGSFLAAAGVVLAAYGITGYFGLPLWPWAAIAAGVVGVWLAGRMITHPNPVYSAICFGGVVLSSAVLVLLAGAHFLAAVLVVVYAGAILVAYVFVIMLAQQDEPAAYDINVRHPVLAVTAGLGLIVAVLWALASSPAGAPRHLAEASTGVSPVPASAFRNVATTDGNVVDLGTVLFGRYPVTIEVAGVTLLVAMTGALVLAGMRFARGQSQEQ